MAEDREQASAREGVNLSVEAPERESVLRSDPGADRQVGSDADDASTRPASNRQIGIDAEDASTQRRAPAKTRRPQPSLGDGPAPDRTVPGKTAWADVEQRPPQPPVREAAGQRPPSRPLQPAPVPAPPVGQKPGSRLEPRHASSSPELASQQDGFEGLDVEAARTSGTEPRPTASRPAPPPPPMRPISMDQVNATVSEATTDADQDEPDEGGLFSRLRARFASGDDGAQDEKTEEPAQEDDGPGVFASLREKLGFGSDDEAADGQVGSGADGPSSRPSSEAETAQRQEELTESLQERVGEPKDGEKPAEGSESDEPEPPARPRGSVDPGVAQTLSPDPEPTPPRPTDRGQPVPATPVSPSSPDGDGAGRAEPQPAPRPEQTRAPAPPAGGDPVPGHPDLGGQPATRPDPGPEFEDVDVPDPEVLAGQVDDVLDRYASSPGPRRGSR